MITTAQLGDAGKMLVAANPMLAGIPATCGQEITS